MSRHHRRHVKYGPGHMSKNSPRSEGDSPFETETRREIHIPTNLNEVNAPTEPRKLAEFSTVTSTVCPCATAPYPPNNLCGAACSNESRFCTTATASQCNSKLQSGLDSNISEPPKRMASNVREPRGRGGSRSGPGAAAEAGGGRGHVISILAV